MKSKIIFILLLLNLTSCATHKKLPSLSKLNKTDRIYVGNLNVKLNDNLNPTCDFYLRTSITADMSTKNDFQIFKSKENQIKPNKIVCLYEHQNKKYWISHNLNLKPISKTQTEKIIYFGDIKIDWEVTDDDFLNKLETAKIINSKIENLGTLRLKVETNVDSSLNLFFSKYPEYKNESSISLLFQESSDQQ